MSYHSLSKIVQVRIVATWTWVVWLVHRQIKGWYSLSYILLPFLDQWCLTLFARCFRSLSNLIISYTLLLLPLICGSWSDIRRYWSQLTKYDLLVRLSRTNTLSTATYSWIRTRPLIQWRGIKWVHLSRACKRGSWASNLKFYFIFRKWYTLFGSDFFSQGESLICLGRDSLCYWSSFSSSWSPRSCI